jgi:hypothetical protein
VRLEKPDVIGLRFTRSELQHILNQLLFIRVETAIDDGTSIPLAIRAFMAELYRDSMSVMPPGDNATDLMTAPACLNLGQATMLLLGLQTTGGNRDFILSIQSIVSVMRGP